MSTSFAATDRVPTGLGLLDRAEAEAWGRRLRATAHPCGCKSGAVASLAALVGWPVFAITANGLPRSIPGGFVAIVVYGAVVIGAAFAGKVAGIVVGRMRHRRLRRRLLDRLAIVADDRR
jgi:hypothetical protein